MPLESILQSWSDEDKEGFCRDFEEGWSIKHLAEKYGIAPPTVYKYAHLLGVSRRRSAGTEQAQVVSEMMRAKKWTPTQLGEWARRTGKELGPDDSATE